MTGALHMGHALNGTVQDALIRMRRMEGRNALWILGTDHAGIGTQMVVEKQLRAEGSSRHELGREAFVERVWEWRREYGSQIVEQYKRLGASCDYERERFTLDEDYVRAVIKVFVSLYEKGLIYRDNYMVSWDPGTQLGDLGPRGRQPRGHRHPVRDRLPGRGLRRGADGRHGAPGDDARRHRGRGEPRRRALQRRWSAGT